MPAKKREVVSGESVKFDWALIDGIYVPVIFREKTRYLSVRIAELKFLSRFSKVIPEDLGAIKRCVSLYITDMEASVLDEINLGLCKGEYGEAAFNTNDVIVELNEFRDFFDLVSDTIICTTAIDLGLTDGGWLQLNNTVCPYLWVNNIRHLPHAVVCRAAELIAEDYPIPKIVATDSQLAALNKLCESTPQQFSFDETTNLVSLLTLKQMTNPVIMELPSDVPFAHATYVDIFLDTYGIQQIQARAKELMNVYYNSVRVQKITGDEIAASPQADPKSSISKKAMPSKRRAPAARAVKRQMASSASTPSAKHSTSKASSTPKLPTSTDSGSVPSRPGSASSATSGTDVIDVVDVSDNNSLLSSAAVDTENRPPSAASTLSSASNPSATCNPSADSNSSDPNSSQQPAEMGQPSTVIHHRATNNTTSPMSTEFTPMSVTQAYQVTRSISSSSTSSSPTCRSPLPSDQTMIERYREAPHKYVIINQSVIDQINRYNRTMGPFSKTLRAGCQVDMAVVELIDKCVRIQARVKLLFRKTLELLSQYNTELSLDNLMCNKEATAIVCDALTNFTFWNASGHKVSVAGADLINTTLVTAMLADHNYSVNRCPDIVHFIVGGVFGARTYSGAINFRFLQELMSIGCIACGCADYSAFQAYELARHRFSELSGTLVRWSMVVSAQPHQITEEVFVRLTYQLYDKVYSAMPLSAPNLCSPLQKAPPSYTEAIAKPANQASPYTQSVSNISPKTFSPPPTAVSDVTTRPQLPCSPLATVHQVTATNPLQVSNTPPAQQMSNTPPPTQLVTNQHPNLLHALNYNTTPHMSLQCPPQPQKYTKIPSTSIPKMKQQTIQAQPSTQTAHSSQNFPLMQPAHASRNNSSMSARQPVASPGIIKPHVQESSPSSNTKYQPAVEPLDCSDCIILSRVHGKKIATYKYGAEHWHLVEDVQKTYFPRMDLKEFVQELENHSVITCDLTSTVASAFRRHYCMTDGEPFEIDKMVTLFSLTGIVSKLKPLLEHK